MLWMSREAAGIITQRAPRKPCLNKDKLHPKGTALQEFNGKVKSQTVGKRNIATFLERAPVDAHPPHPQFQCWEKYFVFRFVVSAVVHPNIEIGGAGVAGAAWGRT